MTGRRPSASGIGDPHSAGPAGDGSTWPGGDDQARSWSGSTTLGEVLESLGMGVLDIVAAPEGLEISVGETVVHGVGEPVPGRPGGVLLATGARLASDELAADIRAAAASGYAAVVVKCYGADPGPLAQTAGSAGVALLTTPDEMSWRHLDSLLGATAPMGIAQADRYAAVGSGDLFSLSNAIAAAVGGAITIEDPDGRVLAYSNLPHQDIDEIRRSAILGRQTPERPTNREEYRSVFAQHGPVNFASEGPWHAGRTAIALWAGRQPLGLIWVINDRPPLATGARELLVDAARVAELQLLRMRGSRDPDRGRRTQALRGVLDGRLDSDNAHADLGLDSVDAYRLLAVRTRGGPSAGDNRDAPVAVIPARIVDLVTLFCEGWDPRSLCVAIDDTVYAIVPARAPTSARRATPGAVVGDDQHLHRLRRMGEEVVTTARRTADLELVVAIGQIMGSPSAVPTGRAMVDRALDVMRTRFRRPGPRKPDAVATLDDVLATVVVRTIGDRLHPDEHPRLPGVAAMLAADAVARSSYAATVLTFLSTMGDFAKTAHQLTIHENTVRYRIKRVENVFGIRFDDPDTMLVTWLQLRLAELSADRP
jgi:hypothetical protein